MSVNNVAETFSRPNNEAVIYDFEQFTLWTNTPGRPGYRSRMSFGERNGAPRITVFPNIQDAPILWVGFDPITFDRFAARFEEIARGESGISDKIDNQGLNPATNGQRKGPPTEDDLVLRNTLHFGKNADGICWIGIEQLGVPKITFPLLPSIWHHFHKPNGEKFTNAEGSYLHTLSLLKLLRAASERFSSRLRPPFVKGSDGGDGAKGKAPASTTTFDDVHF